MKTRLEMRCVVVLEFERDEAEWLKNYLLLGIGEHESEEHEFTRKRFSEALRKIVSDLEKVT